MSRWHRRRRMRFSVTSPVQNALFRRVRFSSPAQTWSHLTQRRILRRRSHVKAQSAPAVSRKSALCTRRLTEKRILDGRRHGKAHSTRGPSRKGALWATARMQSALFRESETPRVRLYVSRRLQSGALVYAVAARFAEASTHTNLRRAENCPPIVRSCSYCWRSSVHSASCLNCCVVI